MRKAYFLVILFLVLAIFLNGCGLVTPDTDLAKEIKEVVCDYWEALSGRQWELAFTYCIPHGGFYNLAEEYQSLPYFGETETEFYPYFDWEAIEVYGNNALANIDLTITVTVCFGQVCTTSSEILYDYPMRLARIGGTWKLK